MKKIQEAMTTLSQINLDWKQFIEGLEPKDRELFDKLCEIGQKKVLSELPFSVETASLLLAQLRDIEEFFEPLGGLKGYQGACLAIKEPTAFDKKILQAPSISIKDLNALHARAIMACLERLDTLAEVYAIGGAADRLNLKEGGKTLPAACLKIAGKTLLEYLIEDVEAKEWLYYKFKNKTLTLPLVMMTSFEKDNQAHIFDILEAHQFFQRPKSSFLIFHQPLLPMLDHDLNWQVNAGSGLFLKPGGHGAIWGLFQKEGIFESLTQRGVKKLSIRQINNPIACVDFGHLAFLGYGFQKDAKFGFFATQRYAGSQEGINVVLKNEQGHYSLTNIEYCQLESCGVEDKPDASGFSNFPANTNVLFADLETLDKLTKRHPLPGQILNYKSFSIDGKTKELARLETMMQNMADYISEDTHHLKSVYMTLAQRHKTISPVKRQRLTLQGFAETPEACFYDFAKNASELLDECAILHEELGTIESYYQRLPFIFTYLPALGPIYEIIKAKLFGGRLHSKAYLKLEIAECIIKDIELKGALTVMAKNPYGYEGPVRAFSQNCGRIELYSCRFDNKGLDLDNISKIHQKPPVLLESCQIVLEGFSEFSARGVTFKGNYLFKVPDGYRLEVSQDLEGVISTKLTKLIQPSWQSVYTWDGDCFGVKTIPSKD